MASLMIYRNLQHGKRVFSQLHKISKGVTDLTSSKLAPCVVPHPCFQFRSIHVYGGLYSNMYYTTTHEWIKIDGNEGTVGITDYAQDKLGEIVFCELPDVGSNYEKGECFATLESVKAASDLYMPIPGEIVHSNEQLEDNPKLINEEPFENGWIVKVKVEESGLSDLKSLLNKEEYEKLKEDEE